MIFNDANYWLRVYLFKQDASGNWKKLIFYVRSTIWILKNEFYYTFSQNIIEIKELFISKNDELTFY